MADGFMEGLRPRTRMPEPGETVPHNLSPIAARLRDLLRAQSAVAAEPELPSVLRRVVLAARELAGARDAVLGVIGADGGFDDFIHTGTDPAAAERVGGPPEGRGVLGVPIRIRDRAFGTLYLTGSANGGFSAVDEQLLVSLAGTAAVAIDNAGLRRESARTGRWAGAAAEVTRRLLTDDGDHLLDALLRYARDTADADFATLALLVDPARLEVKAAIGPMTADLVGVRMGLRANVAGQVARTRIPVLTTVPTDAAATVLPSRAGSAIIVPLLAGGTVRGTLNVGRIRGAPAFTDADTTHLAGFAERVGIAMELDGARAGRPEQQGPDYDQLGAELNEHVIKDLFAVGLSLEGLLSITPEPLQQARLSGCIDRLDATVKRIRTTVFDLMVDDDRRDDLHARLLTLVDAHTRGLGHPVGIRFTRRSDQPLPPVVADDVVTVVGDTMTGLVRDGSTRHVELHVDIASDLVLVEVISDGGNHLIWTAQTTDGAR